MKMYVIHDKKKDQFVSEIVKVYSKIECISWTTDLEVAKTFLEEDIRHMKAIIKRQDLDAVVTRVNVITEVWVDDDDDDESD